MPNLLSLLVCVLLFLFSTASGAVAKDQSSWSYELVSFPDGQKKLYFVNYDSFNEWLYYVSNEGEKGYFVAEDVVSFEYKGNIYYSLPFEDGAFSFFKVEFEGENTALVSKPASLRLMEYLARRYNKIYTLAQDFEGENEIQLCQINYAIVGFGPLSLNRLLPDRPGAGKFLDKYLAPVYIQQCLFVVGEGGIKILQLEVDQDVLMGLFIKDRKYTFESLEAFFGEENYQKMNSYARKNKLEEHQLEDLKMLFKYYDTHFKSSFASNKKAVAESHLAR